MDAEKGSLEKVPLVRTPIHRGKNRWPLVGWAVILLLLVGCLVRNFHGAKKSCGVEPGNEATASHGTGLEGLVHETTAGLGFGLALRKTSSSSGTYQHAAVATDAPQCSKVGVDILRKNGSAVDAAIASLLCVGVVNLHSTGIGGGGFMLYYNATSGNATVFDYREAAPLAGSKYMYNGTAEDSTTNGGLAVAVPGELKGLELAWKKFGSLPWEELFEPAAKIAREGVAISKAVAGAIRAKKEDILSGNYSGLQELLAPDGKLLEEGGVLKRPLYADTLTKVGQSGSIYFYNSSFTEEMLADLNEYDSIFTIEDFLSYTAIEKEAVVSDFSGLEVLGVPPPASGAVLALILNILEGYDFTEEGFGSLAYHRIVEAFKFAYGQRLHLGDPAFNESILEQTVPFMLDLSTAEMMRSRITDNTTHDEDYYLYPLLRDYLSPFGTSHLSVLAENGDAVAATSTINSYFGSLIRSKKSGIIFNDEMDDFTVPGRPTSGLLPDEFNYVEPGKRPQSSTTPTVMLDSEGKVRVVAGASGGTKITTAVAQVLLDVLRFGKPLSEAVPYPRLHHQLNPNHVTVEKDFPEQFRKGLEERHHEVVESSSFAVVQAIHVENGEIHATSDPRKGGKPDGY